MERAVRDLDDDESDDDEYHRGGRGEGAAVQAVDGRAAPPRR
jgi:hypothetical protein